MNPDTPTGETGTAPAPSNETGNTSTPSVVTVSADVEAAKREAAQATIRANQLANEKAKLEADIAAAKAKQLEEKEEFKTLYEQTQAKLKEIEDRDAAAERAKELSAATEEVYKDYDAKAVELAKVAGLSLSDDSEASRLALKEKLDLFQKQVGTTTTPGSNNPRQTAPEAANREEMTKRVNPWEGSAMALAGAKGDDSLVRAYIKDLPAIQRMKEIANGA